jgi:sigma-B regulation protein RsbU (phosphoserine phosphatase)
MMRDTDVFGRLRTVRLWLFITTLAGLLIAGFIVYRTSRHLERLRLADEEQERISSELRVASHIQQSMLPCGHLSLDGIDIAGQLVPARLVGGDLFDYFVRDGKLFFCIGDVSGKGTPSAMLMASTRSLLRAFSVRESNPAHILAAVNEAASQNNETNMFATLFVGVLDLPTGHLRYCDAGHEAPIHISENNSALSISQLPVLPHLPVGVFADTPYTMQEAQLQAGDRLFLYTDGLTEAKRSDRQQFGLSRVEQELRRYTENGCDSAGTLAAMSHAMYSFVDGAEQSDDLTMLIIRYEPQPFNCLLSETLHLRSNLAEVPRLGQFQKDIYTKLGLNQSLASQLRLAVEEAVVNVMEYAYPTGTQGNVEVKMMSDGHSLKVVITDSGVPFDPTVRERTDITLAAEERQIGGLGIHLVRELMDGINYEHTNGLNILTLTKKFNS